MSEQLQSRRAVERRADGTGARLSSPPRPAARQPLSTTPKVPLAGAVAMIAPSPPQVPGAPPLVRGSTPPPLPVRASVLPPLPLPPPVRAVATVPSHEPLPLPPAAAAGRDSSSSSRPGRGARRHPRRAEAPRRPSERRPRQFADGHPRDRVSARLARRRSAAATRCTCVVRCARVGFGHRGVCPSAPGVAARRRDRPSRPGMASDQAAVSWLRRYFTLSRIRQYSTSTASRCRSSRTRRWSRHSHGRCAGLRRWLPVPWPHAAE